jgi:hypothetical protein
MNWANNIVIHENLQSKACYDLYHSYMKKNCQIMIQSSKRESASFYMITFRAGKDHNIEEDGKHIPIQAFN